MVVDLVSALLLYVFHMSVDVVTRFFFTQSSVVEKTAVELSLISGSKF